MKLLNTLPLGNVKSLPAWNMLAGLGEVAGKSIVESSSGNTVFSMGLLAQYFGIDTVKAIASRDVSPGKLDLLKIAGVDIELVDGPICPSPNDPKSSIVIAKQYAKDENWLNPGQYDNPANPAAHGLYTGPQIFDQLDGRVDMFVAGLGTTGTLAGTASYLLSKSASTKIIGIVRAPNNHVPGVRTINGLDEVSFDWKRDLYADPLVVNEYDSYFHGLQLVRAGLLVGPSAGFAYAGVLKQLQVMDQAGQLDEMNGANVVFVAPDSVYPYVSEYFEVLGDELFPVVVDKRQHAGSGEASSQLASVAELTVQDVYDDFKNINDIPSVQHYHLIDIRDEQEFLDHHLPCSTNVPYLQLDTWLAQYDRHTPIVFVCRRGATSIRAAHEAQQQGIDAYSMAGGTAEWSACDYPRVRPQYC